MNKQPDNFNHDDLSRKFYKKSQQNKPKEDFNFKELSKEFVKPRQGEGEFRGKNLETLIKYLIGFGLFIGVLTSIVIVTVIKKISLDEVLDRRSPIERVPQPTKNNNQKKLEEIKFNLNNNINF